MLNSHRDAKLFSMGIRLRIWWQQINLPGKNVLTTSSLWADIEDLRAGDPVW